MRKTVLFAALSLIAAAAPAGAQHLDPTTKVKGSGVLPTDWKLRFDPPLPAGADRSAMSAIKFTAVGPLFRIVSGPAAIYYNTKDVGKDQFAVNAIFQQGRSFGHEAYGLFIGGSNLQDATQDYLYFVVRPQDGMAMISHRAGNAAPKAIMPYFASPAINKEDPKDGKARNALTIHVAKDSVHFVANGKLVAALAKSQLDGAKTDGQVGLRVNHNLDLRVSAYSVTKG